MHPVNKHAGEPITGFTLNLAAYSYMDHWYMVSPVIFLLSINYKKNTCFIFKTLRDTAHPKSSKFAKHLTIFKVFVSLRISKINHFLNSNQLQKEQRDFFISIVKKIGVPGGYYTVYTVYCICMINLSKWKKGTAILKL